MVIEYPFYEIAIPLLTFAILYIILHSLFSWIFPKFKNIQLKYKVAFLTALSHFFLTTYLCIRVATLIKSEPEIGMILLLARFYDFPFFFILTHLETILRDVIGYNLSNIIAPFIALSILGSLAYAFLGFMVGNIIERSGK